MWQISGQYILYYWKRNFSVYFSKRKCLYGSKQFMWLLSESRPAVGLPAGTVSTVTIKAQLYEAGETSKIFSPIEETLITLTPSITDATPSGTLLSGEVRTNRPVEKNTKLMLVYFATSNEPDKVDAILGYVKASLVYTWSLKISINKSYIMHPRGLGQRNLRDGSWEGAGTVICKKDKGCVTYGSHGDDASACEKGVLKWWLMKRVPAAILHYFYTVL